MLDVGDNIKNGNKQTSKHCPVCDDKDTRDSQEHLMFCPSLIEDNLLVQSVIRQFWQTNRSVSNTTKKFQEEKITFEEEEKLDSDEAFHISGMWTVWTSADLC